ncbi:MAG: LemA family protein [Sphaerochaeta sp.]
MSAKKPYFKDRRSAVISTMVVVFLLVLGLLAIDSNNVRRLGGYQAKVDQLQKTVESQMEARFAYAASLASLLDDEQQAREVIAITDAFEEAGSIERQSELYRLLDDELAMLQRTLFADPAYVQYAPYFEKMYEVEQQLGVSIASYNEGVEFYNRQIQAFPANLVAKRRNFDLLGFYTIASALQGRP